MAHDGWDSYFDNLPPLSSDPGTFTTPESEGTLSQRTDNFIGNAFSATADSYETPGPNSSFNANYCQNPSPANSNCVYQRYCSETQWQGDGEQMERNYLQRCGNSDIPDFPTVGLSTSESFPSSFPTDLQGLKQDCGILEPQFLENYSDVSSCSDVDAGETRPSCKFMANNSFPKPKTDVSTKQCSSEWFFNPTENRAFQSGSVCPDVSEINVTLSSNVKTGDMESPEKTVKSYARHDRSSCTTYMVTTKSETARDKNNHDGCQDQKQVEDVDISKGDQKSLTGDGIHEYPDGNEEDKITSVAPNRHDQSSSTSDMVTTKSETTHDKNNHDGCQYQKQVEDVDITKGGHKNLTGDGLHEYPDGNEEEKITSPVAPNTMHTPENEPDRTAEKVSGKEIKELFNQDNEHFGNPNSTDGQGRRMHEDEQDKTEGLKRQQKEPGSLENEITVKHKSAVHNSTNCQDENIETDCQEKENQTNTPQPSHSPDVKSSHSKDNTNELSECSETLRSNSHVVESNLWSSENQSSESVVQDTICRSLLKMTDGNASVGHLSERFSTDVNLCLDKELTSAPDKTKSDCSGPDHTSSSMDTGDKTKQDATCHVQSCLQSHSSSTDANVDPHSSHSVTGDNNKPSVSSSLESCFQPDISSTDINSFPGKEWTGPQESIRESPPPDEQELLHKSLVDQEPLSLSGNAAENARESFEELDTSTEERSVSDMLYGEPLSREDSSCDLDETKLVLSHKESSVVRPDEDSTDPSERQAPQLKPSVQMRKSLHPVVILKTLESTNGMSNSYQCANCQHATQNADHLIEHHHCCHSMQNVQFCKTCNIYLIRNEQAERHLCGITKEKPQLPNSSLRKKRKRHGPYRCIECRLVFSKVVHYIQHMRIHTGKTPYRCKGCGVYFSQSSSLNRHRSVPGRCRRSKAPVKNSDAAINKTTTSSQKYVVQNDPYAEMPKCYVKLIDISKTNLCSFPSAEKGTKNLCSDYKKKSAAVLSKQHATTVGAEKSQEGDKMSEKHKCPLCPRLFKYSFNRARHLRDCVRQAILGGKGKVAGKYQCPLCKAAFTLPSNRFRHLKSSCLRECINRLAKEKIKLKEKIKENGEQQKTKESEQKPKSKENELKKPAPSASTALEGVPHYKCSLCPAVFCHSSGKYRHMKKHELFKLTGKKFKYRKSVFNFMSKPETSSCIEKPDECKGPLKSDEANGDVALSCRFCEKGFSTEESLKKHQRNHRGERPFRCLECGKRFKRRGHLLGHKAVHQRKLQCTVCKKILPTVGELIKHRSSHLKKGMLQRPECDMQFQHSVQLDRHLNTLKNRDNKTPQLEEITPSKPQESLECVEQQHELKQLQCSLCKEVFNDAQILRKHCLTHISRSSSHQCPFCKLSFSHRRYLLKHMIKHTGQKPFSCKTCGKQFYRYVYFKLHSKTCSLAQTKPLVTEKSTVKTKRPYHCSYCPRRFCKKIRLKNHHNAHNNNTLRLCTSCGQYYGITKFNQHQRECWGNTQPASDLPSSDSVRESTSEKKQNIYKKPVQANATKMLQLKCPHCPQRYRFKSVLLRHIVSHTGLQPYPCMHCGHRFGSQSMCFQHEAFCDGVYQEGLSKVKSDAAAKEPNMPTLRETAQKPQADGEAEFKCKFCTKTFIKARSLRHHILTHNEVKPYRCKACDSCFSRYDHLKVHQARCKGKKMRLEVCIPKISLDDVGKGWQIKFGFQPSKKQETFECEVCSRSFSAQSKLSRHVTMFHAPKLFKCTRCDSEFSHERSLKKHKKMKKCRRPSRKTTSSPPLGTQQPAENVTRPLDDVRNRILRRINPYNKKNKNACSYCPRVFTNTWQLNVHLRFHTGEKPYHCEYCGQSFVRKDYVKRHFAKCTKKHCKVLCDRCGGFFFKSMLETHRKGCTSPISSVSTVFQRKQSVSESAPKGFSCAYCSSRFLLFSQLQEHFLSAHKLETMVPRVSAAPLQQLLSDIPKVKEEPLDERCDEGMSHGTNVICKLHTTLDNEVPKSFYCPDCDMSFASKAGLTGHLRTHTVGHPFNCKICNRGFWNKSLLRNHYRKCRNGHIATHQSEVPLKAQIDFALSEPVLVFKDSSTSAGTGVLQTNFSCKREVMDEAPQNSEEDQIQSSSSQEKKAVQYQCSECDQSFTDGLMLISHLEDHGRQEQEKKRNTCTKCGRVCTSQESLEKHLRIHGMSKNFSCPDCSTVVCTLKELEVHRSCHDTNRPFVCKLCNLRFWTRPSLCNHYREDHADEVFTCRFCSKAYAVKKSLVRHYKKWHENEQRGLGSTMQGKSNSEPQSSSQVSTTGESDEDEKIGSEDSDSDSAPYFPCHVCGKTFPTSESLEDHQLCHLGEKPHECAECGKCFVQAAQLQQHQRMHKSEFQCQACGRGFVSLFALRKHKHTHGKSRPYRCSKCHLSFTGPSMLAEHMTTHREQNFPCDICSRVFLSKSSRAEHRKSHSESGDHHPPSVSRGDRERSATLSESSLISTTDLKYRCGVCGERFRDPEELSEHGCMKAEERPYSCRLCNKHFLHASHLKKHRNDHVPSWSNREYPCNQCKSSFISPQQFLSHLKRHANTEGEDAGPSHNFICPVCHQCFASATELIFHFPTHPNGTLEGESIFPSGSEQHHLASAAEYECAACSQRFLGSEAFLQHQCPLLQKVTETEYSNPSAKVSRPTIKQAAGEEEEEVDIMEEDLYNCSVCAMQFTSKSGLLEHQNTQHPNDKPFKCGFCGKRFAKKRYVRVHEVRHRPKMASQSEEKKFKCIRCCALFNTAHDLSLHMRVHAGQEVGKYRCDMCYKSFSQASLLKQHQESHVGEVVYECTECDKAFAFPHLLEKHQQSHAGSAQ